MKPKPPETTARVAPAATPAADAPVSLLLYSVHGVKAVQLGVGAPVVVGRVWPADVVVDDASLSRTHARFTLRDGVVVLEDLGSTNGTWLNGERVTSASMRAEDEVRIGDVSVSLHVRPVAGAGDLEGHDAFVAHVEEELTRAQTFARPMSLLMLRADEAAPGATASFPVRGWLPVVREMLRPVDRASLWSSDTMLVCLPEMDSATARQLASKLLSVVPALRAGHVTFPADGASSHELLANVRAALGRTHAQGRLYGAAAPDASVPAASGVVVHGARMREIMALVERVAPSAMPVLVLGETGSGKEVLARAIHDASPRREAPLKSMNCAAIPSTLLEGMLFGHERGAFTGADRTAKGLFEQAHGGTVMLDEVGELSPAAQAALLRVLETRRVTRVGGDRELEVDVRVVAATHRDLEAMCREGTFRWDLFYRLHTITLHLPPLRERTEEIAPLAAHFLAEANRVNGRAVRAIHPDALDQLVRYAWPGNVRELRNVIERAVVITRGDVVTVDDLSERVRAQAPPRASSTSGAASPVASAESDGLEYKERLKREMARYETELIVDALRRAAGNQTAAARALNIPLRTLTHKIQALGIKKTFE